MHEKKRNTPTFKHCESLGYQQILLCVNITMLRCSNSVHHYITGVCTAECTQGYLWNITCAHVIL